MRSRPGPRPRPPPHQLPRAARSPRRRSASSPRHRGWRLPSRESIVSHARLNSCPTARRSCLGCIDRRVERGGGRVLNGRKYALYGKNLRTPASIILPLEEHPAVAFEVLDAVPAAGIAALRFRQDRGAGLPGSLAVRIHVLDVHQHPVDDPGNGGPSTGRLATLSMAPGILVLWRRRREHDHTVAGVHLTVGQSSLGIEQARALSKAKRPGKPLERSDAILVGQHRNHCRIVLRHWNSSLFSILFSPRTRSSSGWRLAG